ncbi:MAG: HAD-IC family P-type ATPase [Actinomycetota bacterium]|nr:HAD-IC family P-type ATPase [Actinomycetota bacterium]
MQTRDGAAPPEENDVPESMTAASGAPVPSDAWHALEVADALGALEVEASHGLTSDQATTRLDHYGPNRLAEATSRSALARFGDQFKSPLVLMLAGAGVLAAAVGDVKDLVVIFGVLLFNSILGFIQEGKAEEALGSLRSMLEVNVRVRRNGRRVEIPADELVPGDIVMLDAGDRVPADGRLLSAASVAADESMLTGESVPADKTTDRLEPDTDVADRRNVVYMNTTVVRGRAEVLVTSTGMGTEVGQIAGMLSDDIDRSTPLDRQLQRVGTRLAMIAVVAVAVVFGLEMVRGTPPGEAALSSLSLAVAAIPEGLPAVVTVTLALGVRQMAQRNAIVKRLASVETLGSTTVICSDKTGTLTLNEMTVSSLLQGDRRYDVTGHGYRADSGEIVDANGPDGALPDGLRRVLEVGALCNDSSLDGDRLLGDPTEGALVVVAEKAGIDVEALRNERERTAELPFDSETKVMATVHRMPGAEGRLLAVKGASDVLIERCDRLAGTDGIVDLDDAWRETIRTAQGEMSREGLRVLALAYRELPEDHDAADGTPDQVAAVSAEGLVFAGLAGIVDPPRPEAAEAIATCRAAGVSVKMITGDHPETAAAIADQLGLEGRVVRGSELDHMDDEQLAAEIDDIAVCARVSPQHKVRIVDALRARGDVVAMTGDGVNDAAALRRADIGVAMGITGTDVTKEASDIVLTDDNFASIVAAVERGRTIFKNIVTFIRFQLATNISAIFSVLGAVILGLPVPFTPVQILFVNIIADGPPAMLLGVDPPMAGVMDRPPRRQSESILTLDRLGRLIFVGLVMAIGTLAVLAIADDSLDTDVAITMSFTTFVLYQLWNALNTRSEAGTIFSRMSLTNGKLWLALIGVALVQVAVVHVGFLQTLFDTEPLNAAQWGVCLAVSLSVVVVEELRKLITRAVRS